jgi:hypothetical protein
MNVGTGALHGALLVLLAFTVYSIARVRLARGRYDTSADASRWAWGLLPTVPGLWTLLVLLNTGSVGMDSLAALVVWAVGWWCAREMVDAPDTDASGVLCGLLLAGVHIGLMTEAGMCMVPHRAWLWVFTITWSVALGLWWWLRRGADWRTALADSGGMKLAVGLAGLALLLAFLQKASGHPMPVYAPASLAFLLGVPVTVSRLQRRAVDVCGLSSRHRLLRWTPALVICGLTVLSPLAMQDFSPVLLLALSFVSVVLLARERQGAMGLASLLGVGLLMVYSTGLVPRLEERVSLMVWPWAGKSSQMAGNLWAVSRGGLAGCGPGQLATVHTSMGIRPAITLWESDGILATLAESCGVWGVACVLITFGVLVSWFFSEGRRGASRYGQCWFYTAGTLMGITAVWSAAWTYRMAPLAGLAVPLVGRGWGASALWLVVMVISLAISDQERAIAGMSGDRAPLSRAYDERVATALERVVGGR